MAQIDTPLTILEKEIEAFKKELEDKLKVWNKIEFKAKNLDKEKYKESVTGSVKELNELKDKSDDFIKRANDLKKENELATVKEKDFEKRKANEIKKAKEHIKKIEKCLDHFKQDVTKLEKHENEELKKANKNNSEAANKAIESLAHIFQPKKDIIADLKNNVKSTEHNEKLGDENKDEETEDEDDENDKENKKNDAKGSALANLITKTLKPGGKTGLVALAAADPKKSAEKNKEKDESESEDEISDEDDESEKDKVLESYEKQLMDTNEEADAKPEPKATILKKNEPNKQNIKNIKNVEISTKPNEKNKSQLSNDKVESSDEDDISDEEDDEDESVELGAAVMNKNPKFKQEDDSDEDEDEEEDDYSDDLEVGTKFIALQDFQGEQTGDLQFKENEKLTLIKINDKNWYLVKNEKGKEGLAPRNYLKILKVPENKKISKKVISPIPQDNDTTGLDLWKVVKEQIRNKTFLDPEALKASGLIPGSFSSSQLEKLSHDQKYSYRQFLTPKLSNSNLMFSDFIWDLKANKLRSKLVTLQKIITITKCTHIPIPKTDDLKILGRFVRICIYDGKQILSNIHIVKAKVENDETTWLFNEEVDEFAKIIDCSEVFIRCKMPTHPSHVGLLFELAMHGLKISTNEETHVSCGWAHLPFIDEQKNMIGNKGYDLILNGGGIFDQKGKPLNEDLARLKPNPSLLDNLIDKLFRESKIKFDVHLPNYKITDRLNCLPEPIVSSTILASFMRYYLEELASVLIKPAMEIGISHVEISALHSPFLASFIKSLEFPDVLDAVQHAFEKKKGLMSRDQRNDETYRRKLFVELYTKIAYPILHINEMPDIHLYDDEVMEKRDAIIERHWQAVVKNTLFKSLLSETEDFEPFDLNEISYETVNQYSY